MLRALPGRILLIALFVLDAPNRAAAAQAASIHYWPTDDE